MRHADRVSDQGIVRESSYERDRGVEPVKIATLKGLRKRAKRGLFEPASDTIWSDGVRSE